MNCIKARIVPAKKGILRRVRKARAKAKRKTVSVKRRVSSSLRRLAAIRRLRATLSESSFIHRHCTFSHVLCVIREETESPEC